MNPPFQNFILFFRMFCDWIKYNQNSNIRSIKNSFNSLPCGLQDFRKSRHSYTPESDKLASAKYCPLTIANIAFIQVLFRPSSPHPSKILASREAKQLCWVWWSGILQCSLTSFTLQSYWYYWPKQNKNTVANPLLRISACKDPRKTSYTILFEFRVQTSAILLSFFCTLEALCWDSDPDFPVCI